MKKLSFLAIIAMAFAFVGCDQNKPDDYADYPQLIVGKWFNIAPDASFFFNFKSDNTYYALGYDKTFDNAANTWMEFAGNYHVEGNILTYTMRNGDNKETTVVEEIKIEDNKFISSPTTMERIKFRVQEQFDIKGNYSYLNSVVRVEPAAGKTALQLPEGVTFQGQNAIPVEAMHGDRIVDVMKKFFADATFAADGKLNHTLDGEAKTKNYTLDGNNLTFNLYEGSETYKVNATSFPDEDGDRLFIIIPKQAAWLGGMVDLVEKENAGLKLTEAQIAELEKEFMATFDTFTVILSLSKK